MKQKAHEYFKLVGINPEVKPTEEPEKLAKSSLPSFSTSDNSLVVKGCSVSFVSVLFYTYVEVDSKEAGWRFEGHSGGIGFGGGHTVGVLTYNAGFPFETSKQFHTQFLGKVAGGAQVSWVSGDLGCQANAAGMTEGAGEFYGSGKWDRK